MFTISVFAVLLQTIYWYRDIYNNRDISDDNYRRQKFLISPITTTIKIELKIKLFSSEIYQQLEQVAYQVDSVALFKQELDYYWTNIGYGYEQ